MKNILKIFFVFMVGVLCVPVFALEHSKGDVVPVGESATVSTDLFKYTEISYSSSVPGKEYGRFNFQSVTNVSSSSAPISIDILLFDAKKENIGYVTYCTEQDYGGDFAQKKLGKGASTGFYINVTSRYFVDGKGPTDVLYYSVFDENKYCHVGGYTKYAGLTMEEIANGKVVKQTEDGQSISFDADLMNKLGTISLVFILTVLVASVVSLVIQGVILNALHKRMIGESTTLAYVPIANQYIAVKLAFGENIAKIYVVALVVSIPLIFLKLSFVSTLISLVGSVAFIIDIVKLITKNYNIGLGKQDQITINVAGEDGPASSDAVVTQFADGTVESGDMAEIVNDSESVLNLDYSNGSLDTSTTALNVEVTPADEEVTDDNNIDDESMDDPFDASILNGDSSYDDGVPFGDEGFQNDDSPQPEDLQSFLANPSQDISEASHQNDNNGEGESDLVNLFK